MNPEERKRKKAEQRRLTFMLSNLEETYCEGCKKKPLQTSNNSTVHFCNNQCEIGKRIRSIGNQMMGISKTIKELNSTVAMKVENCAKLKYIKETFPFLRQKDMANILGIAASQISMALKTSNYKAVKPDPSIKEHAENYVKKHYPDKTSVDEKGSKINENQETIVDNQSVLEKLKATEKEAESWREKALILEKKLKETSTDSKIVFALKEENALLKSKLDQKEKIAEFLRNQNSELELKVKSVQFTEKLTSQLLAVKIQECLQQ